MGQDLQRALGDVALTLVALHDQLRESFIPAGHLYGGAIARDQRQVAEAARRLLLRVRGPALDQRHQRANPQRRDLGRDLEAALRREAERQRIERQCERAAAMEAEDARARQRAAIEAAAAARSVDRVQAAAERRQALEARRGEIQQQRHEAEAAERKSLTHSRLERVRSESSAAGALVR